jgi:hypothetical protein
LKQHDVHLGVLAVHGKSIFVRGVRRHHIVMEMSV